MLSDGREYYVEAFGPNWLGLWGWRKVDKGYQGTDYEGWVKLYDPKSLKSCQLYIARVANDWAVINRPRHPPAVVFEAGERAGSREQAER